MSYATLLFASSSFADGFGRALDAGGIAPDFNYALTAQDADRMALRSDWSAVGADLWAALSQARNQLPSATHGAAEEGQDR